MMKKRAISILLLIMLVNALSYGTIIPLLYPYASRFGLNALGIGALLSSFSLFQFLATPVIGRLSDRYGRKPLLLISFFGTGVSQLLFAIATTTPVLFLARILDGITGGNMSVAQAMIADLYPPKDRTKMYGILGATFGFGFIVGPALGGLLSALFLPLPFIFSGILAIIGSILGHLFLPETLEKQEQRVARNEPLVNLRSLFMALRESPIGALLLVSFFTAIGQNAFVIGFQTVTNDVFRLNTVAIGILFTIFGVANVLMQGFGIRFLTKRYSDEILLSGSLILGSVITVLFCFTFSLPLFVLVLLLYMWIPPASPFITALLSRHTNDEDQGTIMGINQSYTSIGQIIGPVLAGTISTKNAFATFLIPSALLGTSLIILRKRYKKNKADL